MQRMTTVFKVQHEVNPRVTLENTGFADAAQVHYNPVSYTHLTLPTTERV